MLEAISFQHLRKSQSKIQYETHYNKPLTINEINERFYFNVKSKTMSAFLIIIGFILAFFGMIFGPHIFHKHIRNTQEAKAMGFLCMLPGMFAVMLGFYLK